MALFYSLFPMGTAAIITVCCAGVWVTIQVTMCVIKQDIMWVTFDNSQLFINIQKNIWGTKDLILCIVI